MGDLISRQGVIDALSQYPFEKVVNCISMIKEFPSAQPYTADEIQKMADLEQAEIEKAFEVGREDALSEIIRCKNCKYWTHIKRTNRYWCRTDDGLYDLSPSPDDFCSRAERREG